MSISKIATCITVTVNRRTGWQQSAIDKGASNIVASATGASRSRLAVQVQLLDLPACKAIKKLFTSLGDDLKYLGAPAGEAKYLIPACRTQQVLELIQRAQTTLDKLKAEFASEYANYLATKELDELATLYNSGNYKPCDQVLADTTITFDIDVVSDSSKYASLFSDEQLVAELTAMNEQKMARVAADAETDLYDSVCDQARRSATIIDKYHSGDGKRCASESACEKLRGVCENVCRLNNTMFVEPSARIHTLITELTLAIPADHELLKQAIAGRAFVDAVNKAIGSTSLVPSVAASEVFDVDAIAVASPAVTTPSEVFDIDALDIDAVVETTPDSDFDVDSDVVAVTAESFDDQLAAGFDIDDF